MLLAIRAVWAYQSPVSAGSFQPLHLGSLRRGWTAILRSPPFKCPKLEDALNHAFHLQEEAFLGDFASQFLAANMTWTFSLSARRPRSVSMSDVSFGFVECQDLLGGLGQFGLVWIMLWGFAMFHLQVRNPRCIVHLSLIAAKIGLGV